MLTNLVAIDFSSAPLPPRLQRAYDLLLTGLSEKEIASALNLSQATLHQYVKEVYKLLGVRSRPQLMARAILDARARLGA